MNKFFYMDGTHEVIEARGNQEVDRYHAKRVYTDLSTGCVLADCHDNRDGDVTILIDCVVPLD